MNDPNLKAVFGTDARDQLVKLFSYIGHYTDTVTICTNDSDCVTVQACNASHTVMVFAHVDVEMFESFQGIGEISCNVKPLVSILKLSESSSTFSMYLDATKNKLVIEGGMDQYNMPTLQIDSESFNIPEELVEDMKLVSFDDDPNMLALFTLLKAWQAQLQGDNITLQMHQGDIDDPMDNAEISISMNSDVAEACKSFPALVAGTDCDLKVSTSYFVDTCKLRLEQRCIGYDPNGQLPLLIGDRAEKMWVRTFIAPIVNE